MYSKKLRATFERQKYQDYRGDGWFCYLCKVAYQYTCECPKHGSERGQPYWLVA